tara:strand:+ start:528 stop:788 length:261 start_codon:yes stop_codon:yes gene_type:complete
MELFYKYGARVYGTQLIVATIIFIYNLLSDEYNQDIAIFSVFLFYVAGNTKFAHGILFDDDGLKRYNLSLCVIFNLLCGYWLFFGM